MVGRHDLPLGPTETTPPFHRKETFDSTYTQTPRKRDGGVQINYFDLRGRQGP